MGSALLLGLIESVRVFADPWSPPRRASPSLDRHPSLASARQLQRPFAHFRGPISGLIGQKYALGGALPHGLGRGLDAPVAESAHAGIIITTSEPRGDGLRDKSSGAGGPEVPV